MNSSVVNWDTALAVGSRFASSGPTLQAQQAGRFVDSLYAHAHDVSDRVSDITGLQTSGPLNVNVVDRRTWIEANLNDLAYITSELHHSSAVAAQFTGAQVGLVMSWLSKKILGQYLFMDTSQLLLVAPNIYAAHDALGVSTRDNFARWVCLHEQTHRVQFEASGWLADFLTTSMRTLLADVDLPMAEMLHRARQAISKPTSGLDILQSPEARNLTSQLMAITTVLEGHADWAMDQAPDVVTDLEALRRAMDKRRSTPANIVDVVLRKLLGLNMKYQQYAQGSAFVAEVIDTVGLPGFNQVWSGPEAMPTMAEIRQPHDWLARRGF